MKAKMVNEAQNFERGQEPKEAMKIGHGRFEDMYDYLNYVIKGRGEDPRDFWNSFFGLVRDQSGTELIDELFDALRHTPAEYQIKWAKDKLDWWDEFRDERSIK